MTNSKPRWLTVPASQWRASDAAVPTMIFKQLAEDHEAARDWRGTAFMTFDDVEEDYAYLVPQVQVFLSRMFAAIPHALYFLDPDPRSCAVLSWLSAREDVEPMTSTAGLGLAVTGDIYAAADVMFLSVAVFAIEMGDDWLAATSGHVDVLQTLIPPTTSISQRLRGDSTMARLREAIGQRF